MKKAINLAIMIFIIVSLSLCGCTLGKDETEKQQNNQQEQDYTQLNQGNENTKLNINIENEEKTKDDEEKVEIEEIDLEKVKPNESGKIMVVMFHNFVETFTPSKYDKGDYTMTFKAFEELLDVLYQGGYRLISFKDFLDNNISVPAGCIPMVFTFDDATSGQFNLIEENGVLKANKNSAVGIMEKFNEQYPDFGLKGTFFVNLGNNVFLGKGSVADRLKYLVDLGFEIGNHTYTHINLKNVNSKEKIKEEVGKNQKVMYELIPDYKMLTFSLPYGAPSNDLLEYVIKGEYEGIEYENLGIVEVGWAPSLAPINIKFNPMSINRVRAPGIEPEDFDLNWWLKNLLKKEEYVSDGNPNKVIILEKNEQFIDLEKLNGKELIKY